ncbi:MAG TPA: hypothetical protein VHO93_06920 [Actinomycetota bacterium]|jgi:hypothetical protein|nr:hypothetical protein [Actinomycetota bacterium]
MAPLKDDMLSQLAEHANVAQFVSFGPDRDLPQRHSRLRGHPPGHRFGTAGDAVGALLALAPSGSVNVRSFQAGAPRGGPFSYGLTRRDDVLAVLRARAGEGLHTIANETVDVRDGGVSGVALGGLVEFAPGDTPRSVERAGTVALGHDAALRLLGTVYGFTPEVEGRLDHRDEFSIHPLVAGVRQTHTVLWEREPVEPVALTRRLAWPNAFSRFLGDKAFGLLVADLLDLPVPATTVVGRQLAPFRFGRATGSGEQWLRTCPAEPVPGRFPTQRGWRDPFALLGAEDPSGTALAAVLAQEGVRARWSGAALPGPGGAWLVEGVAGFGDDFMLARKPPATLPDAVVRDVRRVGSRAAAALGPVRFEWAHDGHDAWVVQLHQTTAAVSGTTIHPGTPSRWRRFDPSLGLEKLRELIATVAPDEGIEVAGDIGVTSHAGDLLRRASIPSRLAVLKPKELA